MANYSDHLAQVNSNLKFLASINQHSQSFSDWQVTACFYTGVHLVNAFLAREANLHFNSHERVKDAISPNSHLAATRLDEGTYLAYIKLRNLSRRSRYLCNGDNPDDQPENSYRIGEKHFTKSFIYLDRLLNHFYARYNDPYPVTSISYSFKSDTPLCRHFQFSKR